MSSVAEVTRMGGELKLTEAVTASVVVVRREEKMNGQLTFYCRGGVIISVSGITAERLAQLRDDISEALGAMEASDG